MRYAAVFSLLAGLLLGLAMPARADMETARRAYAEGHWQAAAEAARETGDADGYAFAAGALLAQLMVEPDAPDRAGLADRARRLAEQALDLDAGHVTARIRLAAALGYRGRTMSDWRAYLGRLPQRGRTLLEEAVAADPDNAWARGMLGAWHLEVARRGGERGLRMLDASVPEGIALYREAIALDPDNAAPRYFLALGLTALDYSAYAPLIGEQVAAARALPVRDAFDAGIHDELDALAARLDDPVAAARFANRQMAR